MKARLNYRIYPTNQQKEALAQLFGCVRYVWNNTLAYCKDELTHQGAVIVVNNAVKNADWIKVKSV